MSRENERERYVDFAGITRASLTLVYHGGPLDGYREAWPAGLRHPDARSFERFAYRPTSESWRYVMQFLVDGNGINLLGSEPEERLTEPPHDREKTTPLPSSQPSLD